MKAEYINHYGSDDMITDAARVSFDKHSSQYDVDRNARLIRYLAEHGHTTPFNHPQITMRETVPIFCARQRFKHVVGFSYSEVSRRYVDDEPEFYTPDAWRARPEGSVKQGSGGSHESAAIVQSMVDDHNSRARLLYNSLIDNDVAPEQARMVLPQSMMTSYYVTGSLAAWARAYRLRADSHAQVEIQQLAEQWGEIIAPLFPKSWEALIAP